MTITKFVLIVWMLNGDRETFSTESFDTMAECKAVREAIIKRWEGNWFHINEDEAECIPYEFAAQ